MSRIYFFGCWNAAGHYLFAPGGRTVYATDGRREIEVVDGIHLDANYAPRRDRSGQTIWSAMGANIEARQRLTYRSEEMEQGAFLRHERGGFTLISWWDRTQGDDRGGCNSTLLVEGSHPSEVMLMILGESFPHIVANLESSGIRLREVDGAA